MVAEEPLAAAVGMQILEQGGNAADAAVATAFALAVTFPEAGNIGGGGFALYRSASGTVKCYDFREAAPGKSREDIYLDADGVLIKGKNHEGLFSVGVPGTVAGLGKLFEEHCSMSWQKLLAPSIELASKGFKISHAQSVHFEKYKDKLFKHPSSTAQFFPNGQVPPAGYTLVQSDLAQTLIRISEQGWKEFYTGFSARLLVAFCDSMGGWIDLADLATYECKERTPTKTTYHGAQIYGMPEPSSGGLTTALILQMLGNLTVDTKNHHGSVSDLHVKAECMRAAFQQRAKKLGDPDIKSEVFDVEKYLKATNHDGLAQSINFRKAGVSNAELLEPQAEGTETTHFSIVDEQGNAISLTYTLEQNYGSGIVAEGLGYLLNNEMGDFNPWPGHTDSTGIIGTSPNLVRPGVRMLSSMSPSIVCYEDKLIAVLGTRGGRTIINSVSQVLDNILRFQMSPWEAVSAPRIHHQWLPDQIFFEEGRVAPSVLDSLSAMGHRLASRKSIGAVMAIIRDQEGGFIGIADPRAPQGSAIESATADQPRK